MEGTILGLKVDVDTYRGLKYGIPNLLKILNHCAVRASVYFSLGPDNSGKAIRRVFTRRGFLQKMLRTRAVSMYGIKTLLYGTLLPAPIMGKCLPEVICRTRDKGHEVGIHAWDHVRWHDALHLMTPAEIVKEFHQAAEMFQEILGYKAKSYAAAAWQLNAESLELLDRVDLLYHSSSRGTHAYFPRMDGKIFKTLEIPTTLPTADEILGISGVNINTLANTLLSKIVPETTNILTLHAEVEGMQYRDAFQSFLEESLSLGIRCETLETIAREHLLDRERIPVCDMIRGSVPGRSGLVAVQKAS